MHLDWLFHRDDTHESWGTLDKDRNSLATRRLNSQQARQEVANQIGLLDEDITGLDLQARNGVRHNVGDPGHPVSFTEYTIDVYTEFGYKQTFAVEHFEIDWLGKYKIKLGRPLQIDSEPFPV